jgi:hypothetical protein
MDTPPTVLIWLAGILVLGASGTGCSFVFVDGPPAGHKKMQYFDCSTSNWLPVVDVGLGAIYGLSAVGAAVDSNQEKTQLAGLAVLTGALVASGAYGFQRTSACREAKAQLMERLDSRDRAPAADPWLGTGSSWGGGAPSPPRQAAPAPAPAPPAPVLPAPDAGQNPHPALAPGAIPTP